MQKNNMLKAQLIITLASCMAFSMQASLAPKAATHHDVIISITDKCLGIDFSRYSQIFLASAPVSYMLRYSRQIVQNPAADELREFREEEYLRMNIEHKF